MTDDWIIRRRHLPHVDVADKPYFVTGVLAGSIPASGLQDIRQYQEHLDARPLPSNLKKSEWELKKHKLIFAYIDDKLDNQPAIRHLANERCAEIVADAFHHFADKRYRLMAYVVMPSHHHWLFLPINEYFDCRRDNNKTWRSPRERISHSIQSFTSNQCNHVLGLEGNFWMDETYDHFARDEAEVLRIINYIEQNPVKAGLVKCAEDWRFSSAYVRKNLGLTELDAIPPK